jgi:formylglycine-generating enzyme required for sulfatase activity/GTPase SAR1 family protein
MAFPRNPRVAPGPQGTVVLPGSQVEMIFRLIPAGEFWMGSLGESDWEDEEPRHRVLISEAFWMAETPVTQEQFAVWTQAKGIEHSNRFAGKPSHPAESLDWHQAVAFCEWLNREGGTGLPEGYQASLPTEAQWEYACRAGCDTEYCSGDGEAALNEAGWYSANSESSTHAVRDKPGNLFGLLDLHGQVEEWCLDVRDARVFRRHVDRVRDPIVTAESVDESDLNRVVRGGSWNLDAVGCRSACRVWWRPGVRLYNLGFRVCLVRSPVLKEGERSVQPGTSEARRDAEAQLGRDGRGARVLPRGEAEEGEVLDSPESWPDWENGSRRLRKIVVGQLEKGSLSACPLSTNFAKRFPDLTHLHLWRTTGLGELPDLPPGLATLDVRHSADLRRVPALPAGLEVLVLEGCSSLNSLGPIPKEGLPNLMLLIVKGCRELPEETLETLLRAAPKLERVDISDCPQLTRIGIASWPRSLDRLDLNGCLALAGLPARWPMSLRRLGLRGTSALTADALPIEFPSSMDYLDLAGTTSLTELPRLLAKPRTLFLHGSGVRKPPASEHGRAENENVAARTLAYLHDVEMLGEGEVRRCKLLLLGNGAAGKTCLALRLLPGKDPVKDHPGTTHGVQFWTRTQEATIGKRRDQVDLHLWDFGGQEIYHNTHRLFLSKGTVFLVLWKPEQDGQQPTPNEVGYQDIWRPLQYWLDLIHLECPTNPRIAIVCTHHAKRTPALEHRWKSQVSDEHRDLPCFFVDSKHGLGEVEELEAWIETEVGDVVNTQGVAVPPYWEIAQRMVEGRLQRLGKAGEHPASTTAIRPCDTFSDSADDAALAHAPEFAPTEMPWAEFRYALNQAIAQAVASDETGRYARLAKALEEGTFELTDDRVDRTLDFLTHGGWVYWDRNLFERRVIIGQQWALDGIYTVLDRRPDQRIFQELKRSHGQFTRKNLAEWAWGSRYSEDEQRLLLSYMKAVGVCFELVSEQESLWREPVFLCLEHLPAIENVRVPGRCAFPKHPESCPVPHEQLHEGHWHALLRDLGATFGTDAIYAADAFFCENREGQAIAITYDRSSTGLGGTITVRVDGPNAADRALQLEAKVFSHLPDTGRRLKSVGGDRPEASSRRKLNDASDLSGDGHAAGGAGTPLRKVQVFLSYAWDPKTRSVPEGYTEPVDTIEAALEADPGITVLRDRKSIRSGEDIVRFMQRIRDVDKVVLIHSDRYWMSPFCMYEFGQVVDSFTDRTEKLADVLVLVEHLRSGWGDSESLRDYTRHWDSITSLPSMLQTVTTEEKLKRSAANLLLNRVPAMAALLDRNRAWSSADAAETTAWVKDLIHWSR